MGSAYDVAILGNLHSSDELQRFLQNPDDSWLSQIGQRPQFYYICSTRYIPRGNKSVLVFSCHTDVWRVFNVDTLMRTKLILSTIHEFDDLDMSTNGDFVYFSNRVEGLAVITKLEDESSQFYSRPKYSKYVVVKGGIVSFKWVSPSTPVLWSSDFTQQLSSFHQLAGTKKCLSVSDEVIACVYDQKCVKFFNVSTKQIVHEMPFDERYFAVHACSIIRAVATAGCGGCDTPPKKTLSANHETVGK